MLTGGCVASTIRSAGNHYFVVIAEDCCWQENKKGHDEAIQQFKKRYNVYKSESISETWNNTQHS